MSALELNAVEIKEKIKEGKLTIVDIFATWCGPCKMLLPIIDELATEYPDLGIYKMDSDQNATAMPEFRATTLPTVIFYQNGVELERFSGFRPKSDIIDLIKKHS